MQNIVNIVIVLIMTSVVALLIINVFSKDRNKNRFKTPTAPEKEKPKRVIPKKPKIWPKPRLEDIEDLPERDL